MDNLEELKSLVNQGKIGIRWENYGDGDFIEIYDELTDEELKLDLSDEDFSEFYDWYCYSKDTRHENILDSTVRTYTLTPEQFDKFIKDNNLDDLFKYTKSWSIHK